MTSLEKSWQELNLSRDEVKNIGEALKNKEFRELLVEYVEETQNPENRKKYQDDIVELEAERGVDCTFVNPEPGFVVKTSYGGVKKAFVNVCSNPLVGKPIPKRATNETRPGLTWSIPFSPVPSRDDYDKKKTRCVVFDVIFHPNTIQLAEKNTAFRTLVIQTALDGLDSTYGANLDRRNYKLPRMKYKGTATPTVIRKKSDNVIEMSEEDKEFEKEFPLPFKMPEQVKETLVINNKPADAYTKPIYVIKQRSDIDLQNFTFDKNCRMNAAIPKELVIEINLPLLNNIKNLTLDIKEKNLQVISEKPAKYKLNLTLPYAVTDDGSANFITDKRVLLITLPVVRATVKNEYVREDSGIESDNSEPVVSQIPTKPLEIESFLDPNLHYLLPSFDCNRDGNSLSFVLNVKNVDPGSIKTKCWDRGFHLKFTSIGSGFFPIHYAFYGHFDTRLLEDVSVEAWDNNVTVQAMLDSLTETFRAGLSEENLEKRVLDEILDLANNIKELTITDNPIELISVTENEVVFDVDYRRDSSPDETEEEEQGKPNLPEPIPKMRTMSEGCVYEMDRIVCRGILKNRMNRSLSESCADEAFVDTWSDSEPRREFKKTVRFSQHIQQQTFRINSSILGQRRKNQKKTKNKRKALERRLSESENSEEGDDRDKWTKSSPNPAINTVITEEPDQPKTGDKEKKKKGKKSNFRSPLAGQLVK